MSQTKVEAPFIDVKANFSTITGTFNADGQMTHLTLQSTMDSKADDGTIDG